MFLTPDPVNGRKVLPEKLKAYADALATKMKISIWLDKNIIDDAFTQAYASAQFHGDRLGDLTHYRELSHVGYWLAELKPLSIQPPISPEYIQKFLSTAAKAKLYGPGASFAPHDESFSVAAENYRRCAKFEVSEYVALALIANLIEAELKRKLSMMSDEDERRIHERRFKYFKKKLYDGSFAKIINGLRYHVFTPRSFATLIESMFAFEGL